MTFALYIDGDPAEDQDPITTPQYDGERLRVQLEDEATSSGYDPACRHCGETITDDGDGWQHSDEHQDGPHGDGHDAEPGPLQWCNSAAITLDPEERSVTVSISVGDPRGAFAMTVRQLSDGRLVLHHPYPGEPMPHMDTEQDYPGTLVIKL